MISVIIPFINEKQRLPVLLKQLRPILQSGHEIILVDGGSTDGFSIDNNIEGITTYNVAKGRAHQMNQGARIAKGDTFWFLHADTLFEKPVMDYIKQIETSCSSWGRFNIKLSGNKAIFSIIGFMINTRSAVSGIATGDQGIFISRDFFNKVGCFDEIEIMEDVKISKKLKKISAPHCIKTKIITSSRRWQANGIVKTILKMWLMRVLFFIGVKPSRLIKIYEK